MTNVRPEWQSLTLEISDLIIGSVTMIAAITFFFSFMKLKERTHGQYMILVLCVVDLIYPIMNILTTIFVRSEDSAAVFGCVGIYIFRFSLYFSTAISIFAYAIVKGKQSFNPYKFRKLSVIICLILALFCPTIIWFNIWGIHVRYLGPGAYSLGFPAAAETNKLAYFVIYDLVFTFAPTLIIAFCYLKVYYAMTTDYKFASLSSKRHSQKLFIYSAIPIICFGPQILGDLFYMIPQNVSPFWVTYIVTTLRRCWGFLNLLAYWFLNPINQTEVDHDDNDDRYDSDTRYSNASPSIY